MPRVGSVADWILVRESHGGDAEPSEHVDFLERTSAHLLEDLFPGLRVELEYFDESAPPDDAGRAAADSDTLAQFVGPVANEHGLVRRMTLRMGEASRRLVGIPLKRRAPVIALESPRAELSLAYKSHLPEEIRYSLRMATKVSHNWSNYLSEHSPHEVNLAFSSQLSLWIIAHIAASKLHDIKANGLSMEPRDIDASSLTMAKVIQYLEGLATTRVERRELSHAVVVAPGGPETRPLPLGRYPEDFRGLKRTPLLADGESSVLWISPAGIPLGWISAEMLPRGTGLVSVANPFGLLAAASRHVSGIGMGLTRDGLITVYENGHPLMVRRGGRWRGLLWKYMRRRLLKDFGRLGGVVFEAAIILSTTRRGGILGIVDALPAGLHEKDLVGHGWQAAGRGDVPGDGTSGADALSGDVSGGDGSRDASDGGSSQPLTGGGARHYPEWLFHALLPTDDVVRLGATALATLASIDGATLIGRNGRLLAYGAVVPSQPSESEGARSAAARALSLAGPVLKVSEDGPVAFYDGGRLIVEL